MRRTIVSVWLLFGTAAWWIPPASFAQGAGWKESPALADRLTKSRPGFIFREADVPPYDLPDPLLLSDGTRVTDADTWRTKRRPELFDFFERQVYGRTPPLPKALRHRTFDSDKQALNGTALRKQVTVFFSDKTSGSAMDILVYLPVARKGPVPMFLIINFGGNHTVHPDPAIRLKEQWKWTKEKGAFLQPSTEAERGRDAASYSVQKILSRGYGLATVYCGDIDPDFDEGFQNGVHPLFYKDGQTAPAPDEWGTIGAWAWGLSKVMDYFEQDKDIDSKRVAVVGHSRMGKAALWAGAQDLRFALVISNNSGCGGAALSKRIFGETVGRINAAFPHWFCANFKRFNEKENALPMDQHELLALIAPRPLYVASADEDLWADPLGEFLSAKAVDPVYRLLGVPGLNLDAMPPLNAPSLDGTVGYHIRRGGHALTDYDWEQYMNFMDLHVKIKGAQP